MDEFLQYLEGMDDPLLTATNKIKELLQENEALKRERDQAAFNADAELKDNLYQTQAHCEHLEATIAEQAKLIERMQADLKLPYKLSPNGGISFSEYLRQAKLAARALEAKEGTK